MSSRHHDLLGVGAPLDLEHHVIRVAVVDKCILKDQSDFDSFAPPLHTLEHFSILNCNRSTRNFIILGIIFHVASMHRRNAFRRNRTNQHRHCPVLRNLRPPIDAIVHRVMIVHPLIVKTHYLSLYLILHCLQFVPVTHHYHFGLYIPSDRTTQPNHIEVGGEGTRFD